MSLTLTGILLAAAAGLNAYLPLLALALAARFTDRIALAAPYDFVSSSLAIIVLMVLMTVELLVDKIPRLDHINDLIGSAIRPAAGAFLLMAVTNGQDTIDPVVAMILGLLIAGTVHAIKSVVRTRVTLASGGLANPLVSLVEDAVAGTVSLFAILLPWIGVGVALAGAGVLAVVYRMSMVDRSPIRVGTAAVNDAPVKRLPATEPIDAEN